MPHLIKLLLVAGARPNFMKIAPVIRELEKRTATFSYALVHTGQHYDDGMSDVFFRDLGIPRPHYHLNVGSGSHARQTAAIMQDFEPVLLIEKPDCVVVFGDVNSTLACSIVAKKLGVAVAHVEAGLRSGDRTMPEEINRIVTDSISDYFFVTEESGLAHLRAEGKEMATVYHVGHVMVDNLLHEVERLRRETTASLVSTELKKGLGTYGVVTLHRPSNVDDEIVLRGIISALVEISTEMPLFFPIHPRTKAAIEQFEITLPPQIITTNPLGYREFLNLWRDAAVILTDSGGLQEESTALGVPCLTLRNNTERPITITEGSNRLVGVDPQIIVREARKAIAQKQDRKPGLRPKLWDGLASGRILDALSTVLRVQDQVRAEPV